MTSHFIAESEESSHDEKDQWQRKVLPPVTTRKRSLKNIFESNSEDENDINYDMNKRLSRAKHTEERKKKRKIDKTGKKIKSTVSAHESNVTSQEIHTDSLIEPNTPPPESHQTDNRVHDKPTFTYATMIAQALSAQPSKQLTLQGIYQWIMDKYPYYQNDEHGWRSSVRHNLSQREYFKKVIDHERGKRAIYELNKTHEDNLLRGLTGRKLAKHLRKEKESSETLQQVQQQSKKVRTKKQQTASPKQGDFNPSPIQLPFTWFNPTWTYHSGGQLYQPLNLFRPVMQYVNADQIINSTRPVTLSQGVSQSPSAFAHSNYAEEDQNLIVSEPPPSPEPSKI